MNLGLASGSAQKALLSSQILCHFSSIDFRNPTLSGSAREAMADLEEYSI